MYLKNQFKKNKQSNLTLLDLVFITKSYKSKVTGLIIDTNNSHKIFPY